MGAVRLVGVALAVVLALGRPGTADTLWIPAEQAVGVSPTMVYGGRLGLQEAGALGDFLVPAVYSTAEKPDPDCFAEFSVDIATAGTYCIWARLRYPLAVHESFALTTVAEGGQPPAMVLGNSGSGTRDWHWDSQGEGPGSRPGAGRLKVDRKAGKFTFRVAARQSHATVYYPLRWRQAEPALNPRLNVLCLTTDPDYVPTDADACRALKRTRGEGKPTARVTPLTLPPLTDAQWRAAGKQPVADWLRAARWYTKDSWREELAYRSAGDIAHLVRQLAACEANAFRLSVFWGGEAYYPSRVAPRAPGLNDLDYLREAVDEGRRCGVKVVAYMNPNALYGDHPLFPECGVRGPDGRVSDRPAYGASFRGKAFYACINHPRYRQFLLDVLREIFTAYRPDGLYVDGLTPHVCSCEHCRTKYREMFAAEMPVEQFARYQAGGACWAEMDSGPTPVGDPRDPDARRLTALFDKSLSEITGLFTRTVKGCKPDAVTVYHSYPKPSSMAYYDGTLTEIYVRQPWVHTAWKFGELAGYSNVFPIPVFFNIYPHERCTAVEARHKAWQGLANGVFPNFWSTLEMKPVFEFVRARAEYYDFARTTPVKFLAMPRDCRVDAAQRAAALPAGVRYSRDRFLAPYVGAYSALMRSGLPVVTLHRGGFHRQLHGFRVLVLANVALLGDPQLEAVREFVRAGGGLVCTHETSLYDDSGVRRPDFGLADVLGAHYCGVLSAAKRSLRAAATQHPVVAALAGGQAVHDEPHVVVRPDGAEVFAWLHVDEAQTPEVPAILVHPFGKGRVVYIPGRPDAIQCDTLTPWVERLLRDAVDWASQEEPPVEVRADAVIGATLFEQPGRRILHLVNYNRDSRYRDDEVRPIDRVTLEMATLPGPPVRRIHRLRSPAELPFTLRPGRVQFSLGPLGEYEVVSVETE